MDYINWYPRPASLQHSFRLELFPTKRHAVLNPNGATFKIFIMMDPPARSIPLSPRGLLCPVSRAQGPQGGLAATPSARHLQHRPGQGEGEEL